MNPQISNKTMEIVSQIIQSSPAPVHSSKSSVIPSASIKEKYEGLLLAEREFILPYEYKRLLTLFEHIDSHISIMKIRRTPSFLSNLIAAIEIQIKT